jgi:hypothetical protein
MACGGVCAVLFCLAGPFAALLASPVVLALLLAVPAVVVSAGPV